MANTRRSQRELADAHNAVRREQMERAIADGRLVIRSMTAHERDESDARWAAATKTRARDARRRESGQIHRVGGRAPAATGFNLAGSDKP